MKSTVVKRTISCVMVGLLVMMSSAAFAATNCSNMKIVKTGTKVVGSDTINSVRVQRTTSACGDMNATELRTFNFPDTNADAGLATALTAFSLGKTVYLTVTNNNAQSGTTIENIQITD